MAIGALRVACAQGDGSPSGTAVSPVYPDPNAVPEGSVKIGVQITEVGCMRTLLLLDSGAEKFEKLIDQRLTEVDFRVFPSAQIVDSRISAADMRQYGNQNQADLVLYATVSTRLKNSMGDFQLFEGEATVQIYSPVSGELMVSQTDRDNGVRNVDPVEAERSAAERAVDLSVQEAIVRGLERAQKLIVHTATITGVQDNNQLLIIMNYLEKMEGIYQVRQISFDRASQVAQIEIIGSPKSDTDWRAFLERMPRTKIVHMEVHSNPDLHSERTYPSWFKPAGN
jgi:hypothetical protein